MLIILIIATILIGIISFYTHKDDCDNDPEE